jgi:hypothetical protein
MHDRHLILSSKSDFSFPSVKDAKNADVCWRMLTYDDVWWRMMNFWLHFQRNVFYEDLSMLVMIQYTVWQSFLWQLIFQCWDPCVILNWTIHSDTFCHNKHTQRSSWTHQVLIPLSWVVTGYGEGVRQKIIIRQVFDRFVIVRGRQEGLSCIAHLPYPWETLEGILRKRFFPFLKKFFEKTG